MFLFFYIVVFSRHHWTGSFFGMWKLLKNIFVLYIHPFYLYPYSPLVLPRVFPQQNTPTNCSFNVGYLYFYTPFYSLFYSTSQMLLEEVIWIGPAGYFKVNISIFYLFHSVRRNSNFAKITKSFVIAPRVADYTRSYVSKLTRNLSEI